MDLSIFELVLLALPLLIAFVLVYWAVRLAIRHERGRDRRQ